MGAQMSQSGEKIKPLSSRVSVPSALAANVWAAVAEFCSLADP